jgi:hypothetical protein
MVRAIRNWDRWGVVRLKDLTQQLATHEAAVRGRIELDQRAAFDGVVEGPLDVRVHGEALVTVSPWRV